MHDVAALRLDADDRPRSTFTEMQPHSIHSIHVSSNKNYLKSVKRLFKSARL